ncbi:MAG TPA: DUF2270 domain-containing protein [Pyrinomonadaceae bacterium]|nr:DUF2270 domain-containing protein [Pyrinomonadaceae bacterium]
MSSDLRPRAGTGPLTGGERGSGRLRAPVPPASDALAETPSATSPLPALNKLSSSEFNTAMIHFYRGEVQRSNTWRNRLDTTTNWAVITAGATLSFTFGDPFAPHFVILINSILIAFFLFMEARRYRYYEIWSSRVRVLETGYFAQILSPQDASDTEWAEHLAADLTTPHFTISEWEAVGRRLRRNYLWLFALLALSWNLKVYLHPVPATDFKIFVDRATIGVLPGWIVLAIGVIFNLLVLTFAVGTLRLRQATGEILPRHEFSLRSLRRMTDWTRAATISRRRATVRRAQRARQRVRTGSIHTSMMPDKAEKTEMDAPAEETLTQ